MPWLPRGAMCSHPHMLPRHRCWILALVMDGVKRVVTAVFIHRAENHPQNLQPKFCPGWNSDAFTKIIPLTCLPAWKSQEGWTKARVSPRNRLSPAAWPFCQLLVTCSVAWQSVSIMISYWYWCFSFSVRVTSGLFFLSLSVSFFWLCPTSCGILVPQPGIEPAAPALEAWSLNHWTTREVQRPTFSKSLLNWSGGGH